MINGGDCVEDRCGECDSLANGAIEADAMRRNLKLCGAGGIFECGLALFALVLLLVCGAPSYPVVAQTEPAAADSIGRGKTVMVDAWFNSQQRLNADGKTVYFHYKWDDATNTGFSLLAQIFHRYGAATDTLYTAPTIEKLKAAQIYIIASPDIPAKNPHPHYVDQRDAQQVAEWVKREGCSR